MGRARDPKSWSPTERAAVERQAAVGRKTVATEALKKEQAAQKAKAVPFKPAAKAVPAAKPKLPVEIIRGKATIAEKRAAAARFVRAIPKRVIRAKPALIERVVVGAKKFGAEAKQFIAGIPRGARGVATLPFAHLVYVDPIARAPYIGAPPKGARTLYEQQAVEYEEATIGGKVGEVFGGLTFATIATQPLVKGITPTTRGVTVTKVTPKGEFKAVGAIEVGEKAYPVAVKGRAERLIGTRIGAKGTVVVRTKPTIKVGAKAPKALKFEGFEFKAIAEKIIERLKPKREFSVVFGKVTRVTKAVVKKGIRKITRVRPVPKPFIGEQVIAPVSPTKAVTAAKLDIFKGFTKIGEAKELGVIRRVPKEFIRYGRVPKGLPTVTKRVITKPVARQISKSIVETIAPSLAKMKTGLPLVIIPRVRPVTKVAPREITAPILREKVIVKPITKVAPVQKVRAIERPVTLLREAQRVTPITQPILKPVVATKVKVGQLQKVRPIEIAIPRTQQVARTTYPTIPFVPMEAFIMPKGLGFGFPLPQPSIALPIGEAPLPIKPKRGFAYQPSVEALALREFGEAPKEAISVKFRPITKKWKKKMQRLFGGFGGF